MKNKKIMVRLDESVYNEFVKQAEYEMRTASDLLRVAIAEYMKKAKRNKTK